MEKAREYLVARKRDKDMLPAEVVYVMGLVDDAGSDARFALAAQVAQQKLQETYPFDRFCISYPGPTFESDGNEVKMCNASAFLGQ
ncbi:MAG TPA: hypothetical protein HA230_03800 [Candidatus Aenigmarchaeota archaeon]|nr:hypothetical protein [Candidatus Aenigmarchaeota archaeon]